MDNFDINGDGLADRLYTNPDTETKDLHAFLNTGSGFSPQDTPITNIPKHIMSPAAYSRSLQNGGSDTTGDFIDLNGDGLVDRVVKNDYNDYWEVYWNKGGVLESAPTQWPITIPSGAQSMRVIRGQTPQGTYVDLMDVNGDGLPDRLFINYSQETKDIHVFLNTGNGFSTKDTPLLFF